MRVGTSPLAISLCSSRRAPGGCPSQYEVTYAHALINTELTIYRAAIRQTIDSGIVYRKLLGNVGAKDTKVVGMANKMESVDKSIPILIAPRNDSNLLLLIERHNPVQEVSE